MTARYEVGELLDLRVPAVRYSMPLRGGHVVTGTDFNGEPFEIWLPAEARYELTRVAPPEWPPVAGDVWESVYPVRWFAYRAENETLRLVNDAGAVLSVDEFRDGYAGRLVSRDGWSPTPPAADPEPTPYRSPTDAERRAEQIAGMRELLELVESNPDLYYRCSRLNIILDRGEHLDAYEALGWKRRDDPHKNTIQHVAAIQLHGLTVDACWIEDLPEPAPVEPAPVDEDQADTDPTGDEVSCSASQTEPGDDHEHRCALYVDAGPHGGTHVCLVPECAHTWADGDGA